MVATILKDSEGRNIISQRQFCTFLIAGRLFGVDILHVKEINRELAFTPVFHAPDEVKGYVNIRGQIHLVLDLRMILGFKPKESDTDSCVLLFKHEIAEPFGVLVDKIGDVVNVSNGEIEDRFRIDDVATASNDHLSFNENMIEGVCKLNENLLVILKAKNFLSVIKS